MDWLYVWLGVIVASVIIESITFEMVSIWFVGGGLVCLVLSLFNVPHVVQLIVFIVVSAGFLLLFRKPVLTKFNKKKTRTNADSAIGKELTLLTPISFGVTGTVKVNGVEWNAVCEDEHAEIEAGKTVIVIGIIGNKYIVKEK
ncbi:MAG: NfeD family protein [Clostridia bacterium]|nr:NfeD family protein [Clostridia bacterium]